MSAFSDLLIDQHNAQPEPADAITAAQAAHLQALLSTMLQELAELRQRADSFEARLAELQRLATTARALLTSVD